MLLKMKKVEIWRNLAFAGVFSTDEAHGRGIGQIQLNSLLIESRTIKDGQAGDPGPW